MKRLTKYQKILLAPVTGFFEIFFIAFVHPEKFLLITVEHLTGWPTAIATEDSTASTVVLFIQKEIIIPSGPLRRIV